MLFAIGVVEVLPGGKDFDRLALPPSRVRRAGPDGAVLLHRRMSIPPLASVTYRLPVVASVAGAQPLAGLRVNHDALAISPKML